MIWLAILRALAWTELFCRQLGVKIGEPSTYVRLLVNYLGFPTRLPADEFRLRENGPVN